jgi:hypothetical protein
MGQRRHLNAGRVVGVLVVLCLTAFTGCGRPEPAPKPIPTGDRPTPVTVAPTATAGPSTDPFDLVDEGLQRMVDEHATWQAPASLAVDRSDRIGLVVGDSERLQTQIDDLVEEAVPREAGPVKVGPRVRVALWVDASDAQVKPSEAVDQSTGSQVAMLWTWIVRPLRASDGMFFIAHVEVPSDGHTFTTDIPLKIPVKRTISNMGNQVFTHWATWSAIVVTLASAVSWLWKRRRGKQATAADGSGAGAATS